MEALAARLAEEGLKHRSADEVAGYGLAALVRWHLARARRWRTQERSRSSRASLETAGPARLRASQGRPGHGTRRAAPEIAQELAEAAERIALRRELERRRKEAKEAAAAPFGDPELSRRGRETEAQGRHGQGQQEGEARVPGRARARGAAATCCHPAHGGAGLGEDAHGRQGAGGAQGRQRADAGADFEEGRGARGRDRAADQAQGRCRRARLHVRQGVAWASGTAARR